MRVVIVGAGIGGLSTALSLHAAGITDVIVAERVNALRPLGVGINVLPHAVRELTELGLADRIETLGVTPRTLTYANRYGQPIWSEPRGLAAGYRWPQVSLHRGEFQLALAEAVRERLGDGAIQLGHKLVTIEHGESQDVAIFETDHGFASLAADVVIGADGIHSAVRTRLHPEAPGPIWSGLTIWRGTAVVDPYLDGQTMVMAGDDEQKFVAYPLGARDADGLVRVNFIAERRADGPLEAVDWNREVQIAPVAELFADWRFDWLDVPSIIMSAERVFEYPMVDLDPVPFWTKGHTTLLGDAAHAMSPNGSNGASQAIIDARTLALRLATARSVQEALAEYDEERRSTTTALLASTRQTGPERVMLLARERAPQGFTQISDVFADGELAEIAWAYKRAAGFDPEHLNNRPSLNPAGVQR